MVSGTIFRTTRVKPEANAVFPRESLSKRSRSTNFTPRRPFLFPNRLQNPWSQNTSVDYAGINVDERDSAGTETACDFISGLFVPVFFEVSSVPSFRVQIKYGET